METKGYVFLWRGLSRTTIFTLCLVALATLTGCMEQLVDRHFIGPKLTEGRGGFTALHSAAGKGQADIVRTLLDSGTDVNAKDAQNRTALHLAAWEGHPDIVRILLDAGADPSIKNKQGFTPIELTKNAIIMNILVKAEEDRYMTAKKPASAAKIAPVAKEPAVTVATKKELQPEGYRKPKIIIINPPIQRGISIIRQASITIRGRVEDVYGVDWVTINGQDAALRSGGLFELTVNLVDENNNFIITAMNKKGATAEKMITLTRKVATLERPAVKLSLPNIFALLIGINNYHDERISDLKYAKQDAQAFYKFLIDPQRGAVLPKRVKLLVGDLATASVIEQNFKRTLRASSPGDMIIIYMATHGVPDPEGGSELFFLASDSNLDSLLKTSISKTDLEKMLSRYVSNRKIILITDACHAGGIGMSSQLMAFSTRSIQQRTFRLLNKLATSHDGLGILSASRANELSQEDSKWGGGHGVFTYYLIRGLGGEADKSPSDGFVTLRELRDYLYDKVSASTSNLQTPELVGNYDPNLPIAIIR